MTCVEHLCPNPPMIHFTNLEYMVLTDPRTAFVCLEMVISGRQGDDFRGYIPNHCFYFEKVFNKE